MMKSLLVMITASLVLSGCKSTEAFVEKLESRLNNLAKAPRHSTNTPNTNNMPEAQSVNKQIESEFIPVGSPDGVLFDGADGEIVIMANPDLMLGNFEVACKAMQNTPIKRTGEKSTGMFPLVEIVILAGDCVNKRGWAMPNQIKDVESTRQAKHSNTSGGRSIKQPSTTEYILVNPAGLVAVKSKPDLWGDTLCTVRNSTPIKLTGRKVDTPWKFEEVYILAGDCAGNTGWASKDVVRAVVGGQNTQKGGPVLFNSATGSVSVLEKPELWAEAVCLARNGTPVRLTGRKVDSPWPFEEVFVLRGECQGKLAWASKDTIKY